MRGVFGRAGIHTYEITLQNERELSLIHGETVQKLKKKNLDSFAL